MELNYSQILTALIAAFLGASGVTPLIIAYMNYKKENKKGDRDFAISNMDRMDKDIDELKKIEKDCRIERENLAVEVAILKIQVVSAKESLEEYKNMMDFFAKRAEASAKEKGVIDDNK